MQYALRVQLYSSKYGKYLQCRTERHSILTNSRYIHTYAGV